MLDQRPLYPRKQTLLPLAPFVRWCQDGSMRRQYTPTEKAPHGGVARTLDDAAQAIAHLDMSDEKAPTFGARVGAQITRRSS
jgi:hypothetical protein